MLRVQNCNSRVYTHTHTFADQTSLLRWMLFVLACYIVTHRLARFFGLAWLPLQMQVRLDDQSQYPEVTIESFVGQRSLGLLCPTAVSVSFLKATYVLRHRICTRTPTLACLCYSTLFSHTPVDSCVESRNRRESERARERERERERDGGSFLRTRNRKIEPKLVCRVSVLVLQV